MSELRRKIDILIIDDEEFLCEDYLKVIGLNFAHKICEMHGIGISYSSRYGKKDHGIVYGTFSVLLKFPYV